MIKKLTFLLVAMAIVVTGSLSAKGACGDCGKKLNACNNETGKMKKEKKDVKGRHEKCQSDYKACNTSCEASKKKDDKKEVKKDDKKDAKKDAKKDKKN